MGLVDELIAYEEGQITGDEEIAFFERLVETGTCWQLQGHYQRVATTLIEAGLIEPPERSKATLWLSVRGRLSTYRKQTAVLWCRD